MNTVLFIMMLGMLCGYLLRENKKVLQISDKLTSIAIYMLLFVLGIGVGLNEKIVSSINTIGLQALAITLGALLGSLLLALIVYKLFFITKNN